VLLVQLLLLLLLLLLLVVVVVVVVLLLLPMSSSLSLLLPELHVVLVLLALKVSVLSFLEDDSLCSCSWHWRCVEREWSHNHRFYSSHKVINALMIPEHVSYRLPASLSL
jgi:hypothetical protein